MIDLLTDVPLDYEANGQPSHAPLVKASIGGVQGTFIVDTGADVHLLTEELVARLGISTEFGEDGRDSSGAVMPSRQVTGVALGLGETTLPLRRVFTFPAPPLFERMGVYGILSPQLLHPAAIAILDMVRGELLLAQATDEQLIAFLMARLPSMALLTLKRNPAFETVVVPAAIDGFARMPALLDTGGKRTEFVAEALGGLEGDVSYRLGSGVSGADVIGWDAGPRTLVIGDRRVPVANLAVRRNMDEPRAIIGMDVLRGTVIACAADLTRPVFLQLPPEGKPARHRVTRQRV